jgi:hypothetical protein
MYTSSRYSCDLYGLHDCDQSKRPAAPCVKDCRSTNFFYSQLCLRAHTRSHEGLTVGAYSQALHVTAMCHNSKVSCPRLFALLPCTPRPLDYHAQSHPTKSPISTRNLLLAASTHPNCPNLNLPIFPRHLLQDV